MPDLKNIANAFAAFLGQKLDNVGVEIKGAELVTIKGEKGDVGEVGSVGPQGVRGERGEAGQTGADSKIVGLQGKVGIRGEKGATGLSGKDSKVRGPKGDKGETGKDVSPEKVNEVIAKLKEVEDELRVARATTNSVMAFSGSTVLTHDLSASLDGVLKTFTLPSNARVLLVISSSFPTIFRLTEDYTATASAITFTSAISASTTLATGQSVIILYKLP